MDRELMQQALEALESCTPGDTTTGHVIWPSYDESKVEAAITALQERLAQPEQDQKPPVKTYCGGKPNYCTPEQEPVAWMYVNEDGECEQIEYGPVFDDPGVTPLYTAPPKREWVGLTADEIWKCNKAKSGSAVEFHICYEHQNVEDFAEAIEAKLKEKNHG